VLVVAVEVVVVVLVVSVGVTAVASEVLVVAVVVVVVVVVAVVVVVLLEWIGKWKTLIQFFGSRSRNLPVCSIVPQPLRYRSPDSPTYS
jgi:hypothetical protein